MGDFNTDVPSFAGVPSDMVLRLLERGHEVAEKTARMTSDFGHARSSVRKALDDGGQIHAVSDAQLDAVPEPSLCAVDGALVLDPRAMGDMCAAVAVALGPDVQNRNEVWIDMVGRSVVNRDMLTAVMHGMEFKLAATSDAELVMVDGSFLSMLIGVSKGVAAAKTGKGELADRAMAIVSAETRDAVMEVLTSTRYAAVPKLTTTNKEFVGLLPEGFKHFDGRTVATIALRAGEMTALFEASDAERAKQVVNTQRQIGNILEFSARDYERFVSALTSVVFSYYRPHPWTPAFRFDVPAATRDDRDAGMRIIKALHGTTMTAGMREPFPLYLVDNFAKEISVGVSPIVDMAAVRFVDDPEALLLMIMGYRT